MMPAHGSNRFNTRNFLPTLTTATIKLHNPRNKFVTPGLVIPVIREGLYQQHFFILQFQNQIDHQYAPHPPSQKGKFLNHKSQRQQQHRRIHWMPNPSIRSPSLKRTMRFNFRQGIQMSRLHGHERPHTKKAPKHFYQKQHRGFRNPRACRKNPSQANKLHTHKNIGLDSVIGLTHVHTFLPRLFSRRWSLRFPLGKGS